MRVDSAVPATTSVLSAGTEVAFTYRVTFALTSETALVGMMFIPDGELHRATDFLGVSTIRRGTTTVTFEHTLPITPETRRLEVFIAMENQDRIGQTSTTLTYQVR